MAPSPERISKPSRTPSPQGGKYEGVSLNIAVQSDRKEPRSPVQEHICLKKNTHKPLSPQPFSFRNSFVLSLLMSLADVVLVTTGSCFNTHLKFLLDLFQLRGYLRQVCPNAHVSMGKTKLLFRDKGAFFGPLETTVNPVSIVDVSMIDSSGSTEAREQLFEDLIRHQSLMKTFYRGSIILICRW